MAIKTFTTGEVLTAADTNTYLANSGLVFVKSQTVGTAVASVVVSSAFSTDYDSYKLIYAGGVGTTATEISITLGSTTTGYYGFIMYGSSSVSTVFGATDNNAAKFTFVGGANSDYAGFVAELVNPFNARHTMLNAQGAYGISNYGTYAARLQNTTSYTAFTFAPLLGTLTGGTITVYGYRKG